MSSDIISTAAGRNQPVIVVRAWTVRPHLDQTSMRPRLPNYCNRCIRRQIADQPGEKPPGQADQWQQGATIIRRVRQRRPAREAIVPSTVVVQT
ncbi:uncharacterized protein PgNI_03180 [Pyricularia grisea]|uniref:Uncharacterized protein n=1 Tax=Pyricularia grisea TaxID=148305 RepID=A0A6P8BCY0_PYRGI|nr:uncharacterized protein PgNI_03180 [Pyricularia grisea]TLD13680.1 hypothetical protein PgNI_03180 [Pyricularia grisea]